MILLFNQLQQDLLVGTLLGDGYRVIYKKIIYFINTIFYNLFGQKFYSFNEITQR